MKRKDLPKEFEKCRDNVYRNHRFIRPCRNKVSFAVDYYPYFICKAHLHDPEKFPNEKPPRSIEEFFTQRAEEELRK